MPSTGVGVGVCVHDQGRVKAPDLAGRGHLTREPPMELRVVRVVGVHDLDRDLPATGRRPQEHPSHATLAKAAKQPERADLTGVARLQPVHPPHPQETRRTLEADYVTRLSRTGLLNRAELHRYAVNSRGQVRSRGYLTSGCVKEKPPSTFSSSERPGEEGKCVRP